MDDIVELENRLIRLLRSEQGKVSLCFRYGDLCALDTIQMNVAPEKKGMFSFDSIRSLHIDLLQV